MRIFIVEDNIWVGMMMADALADDGHTVLGPIGSSSEALELSKSSAIDLALVDIDLRDGRTGGVVARELAQRKVKIVFVSGQQHLAWNWAKHAIGVLPKPITPEETVAVARGVADFALMPVRFRTFTA